MSAALARRAVAVIAACGAVAHARAAVADDAIEALAPIAVIGATRGAEPGSVQTLTNDQINALHPQSVVELLRFLPGVQVDRGGYSGSVSSLYLRGGDPNWTAVFVDGVRINDPTNSRGGSVDLGLLDPGMIERIDIVRGPASALVGSDAIAGVINIVTRRPAAAREASADAEAGSRGYTAERVRANGPVVLGGAAAYAGYVDGGEGTPGGRVRMASANGALQIAAGAGRVSLAAQALRQDAHAFPDDSGGPAYAVLREVDRRHVEQQGASLQYRGPALAGWIVSAQLAALWHDENDTSPGVAPGVRDPAGLPASRTRSHFSRQTVRVVAENEPIRWLRFAAGAQYEREAGHSSGELAFGDFALPTDFVLTRPTTAVFGEARARGAAGEVSLGARVDHSAAAGNVTSPRVAVIVPLSAQTELRASYGEGFKLPSFFALSHPLVGNRDLVPERSRGLDAAWVWRAPGDRSEVSVTAFRMRVDHAIDFDPGPPPRLVNRSRVSSDGVEATWRSELSDAVRVFGQVSHANARVSEGGPLRNRPRVQGTTAVVARAGAWLEGTVALTYVGHNVDSSIPTGPRTLGGYARLDISARWRVTPRTRLTAAIDNVTGRRYEEMVGFPGAPRTVRIGVVFDL